jgi:hypothetical protein
MVVGRKTWDGIEAFVIIVFGDYWNVRVGKNRLVWTRIIIFLVGAGPEPKCYLY